MSKEDPHRRPSRVTFEMALLDAGGANAPRERLSGLRASLIEELQAGARELGRTRSGYRRPVGVALALVRGRALGSSGLARERDAASRDGDEIIAVAPVDQALRADPGTVSERAWLLTAALVGAMVEAAAATAHVPPGDLQPGGPRASAQRGGATPFDLLAGTMGASWLALALPIAAADSSDAAELAVLAFDDEAARIDRLRARAYAVPAGLLEGVADLRAPIGEDHPLRAAEMIARLGGRPADEASVAEYEDAILAILGAGAGSDAARPHEEQDPSLRAARRILQRLAGMGKWGGYHTDVAHLARGFAGNERALAMDVGERLISAGLLADKPSVGQRHVYLNPRRAGDIHALIERGVIPPGLELPRS